MKRIRNFREAQLAAVFALPILLAGCGTRAPEPVSSNEAESATAEADPVTNEAATPAAIPTEEEPSSTPSATTPSPAAVRNEPAPELSNGESTSPANVAAAHKNEPPPKREPSEPPQSDAKSTDEAGESLSGTLFDREFKPDEVELSNGILSFSQGESFIPDANVKLFLFLDEGESLVGKEWNITPDAQGFGNPHVHVGLKQPDSNSRKSEIYMEDYRLQLRFEEAADHQLAGRIELTLPEKSRLSGKFQVDIPDDPTQPPGERHKPFIHGQIVFEPKSEDWLRVGYVGMNDKGERQSNMTGTRVGPDSSGGWAESTTFKPRLTRFAVSEDSAFTYRHVRLEPGTYLVYAKHGETYTAGQWVNVEQDSGLNLDIELQPEDAGALEVTIPSGGTAKSVLLLPLNTDGKLPGAIDETNARSLAFFMDLEAEMDNNRARFNALHPGHYRVFLAEEFRDVQIEPKATAKVSF